MPLVVKGMAEVQRALKQADRDVRLGIRDEYRKVAEPIAREAETLSLTGIRNMRASPKWARTRTGVTQRLVYVAPKERGIKKGTAKRPGLAPIMLARSFDPALERHGPEVRRDFEQMLDRVAHRFNRDNRGV